MQVQVTREIGQLLDMNSLLDWLGRSIWPRIALGVIVMIGLFASTTRRQSGSSGSLGGALWALLIIGGLIWIAHVVHVF